MNLTGYIKIFHDFAWTYPDIAHRNDTNPSFFTSEKKLAAAITNSSRTGEFLLYLAPPFGRLQYEGSQLFNVITGQYIVLKKGGDTSAQSINEAIEEECLQHALFLTGWLNDQFEQNPFTGPVAGFDLGSVQYDYTGPLYGNYYGVRVRFEMKAVPFNIYDMAGRAATLAAGVAVLPPTGYPQLFKSFAYAHPDILHRDGTNPGYFTTIEEMSGKIRVTARSSDYMLLLPKPTGALEWGTELYNRRNGAFTILCKGGDTSEDTRQRGVQSKAMDIGYALSGWLHDLFQQYPDSGPVAGFDINTINWTLAGPVEGGYYGVTFRFACMTRAFDVYDRAGREETMEEGLADRIFGTEFGIEFE